MRQRPIAMEMYEKTEDLWDDPTPPVTPSLSSSVSCSASSSVNSKESSSHGVEGQLQGKEDDDAGDLSDETETVETRSSSEDAWKNGMLYGDASSIHTEDSLEASSASSTSLGRRRGARSEGGKRVTFAEEERLVRVFFIPMDCGPSLEELMPCDPDTLVGDISDMTIEGYSPSSPRRDGHSPHPGMKKPYSPVPSATSSRPGGSPGPGPTPRFGRGLLGSGGVLVGHGVGKYGTPTIKALGRGLCIQGRPSPTSPKPASRKRPQTSPCPVEEPPETAPETGPNEDKMVGSSSKEQTKPKSAEQGGQNPSNNKKDTDAIQRRNIRSATTVGRRRLLPATPEDRLEPLFRHANRKIRSAAWSGKQSEQLQNSAHLLQGHLQARRLQGITSRSTSALHRIKAMENDFRQSNLNRARSVSYDNVESASAAAVATANVVAPTRQTPSTRNLKSGVRRTLTRRSLPVRPDQVPAGVSLDERLSTLNATGSSSGGQLPRVHQSPYRQSSLPPLGQRSVTFVEPGRERCESARSDVAPTGQMHAMKHVSTPLATRKLYAWHMANGTLGPNAHMETPCIAPLWDYRPNTSDSPAPATPLS